MPTTKKALLWKQAKDDLNASTLQDAINAAPKGPQFEALTTKADRIRPSVNEWLKANGRTRVSARTIYRHLKNPRKVNETRLYHPGGLDGPEDAALYQKLPREDRLSLIFAAFFCHTDQSVKIV